MVFFVSPRDIVKLRTPKVQPIVAVADQLWTDQGRRALYFMHYNFVRIHKTLRVTPAMAAGVADHLEIRDIVALLDSK
jgi:hypothetical protein